MGIKIEREEGNLGVVRITGLLRQSEWEAALAAEAKQWGSETRVKVLVIAEDFKGWERSPDWADTTFFDRHANKIDKIAIVADRKWETDFLMFAGAGFRRAPVKFFPLSQLALAMAWLD